MGFVLGAVAVKLLNFKLQVEGNLQPVVGNGLTLITSRLGGNAPRFKSFITSFCLVAQLGAVHK